VFATNSSSIPRKRPARVVAMTIAVGTASVLALSACASKGAAGAGATGGTGAQSPAAALTASVDNIYSGNSASFDLTFQPDAAAIAAMNASTPADQQATTSKLFGNGGLDVKIQISADKPLKDLSATDVPNASVSVSLGGKDYLDVVSVGGAVYLKADVPDALTLAGLPSSIVTGELGKLPPAIQAPAQAALAGKWLSISAADLKSIEALAQTMGGGDNAAPAVTPSPGEAAALTQALLNGLTKDTTITDKGSGELQISGQTKAVAQDVLQSVQPVLGSLPGVAKTDFGKIQTQLAGLPSQNATFDVWIKGGVLSEVNVDVLQFAKDKTAGHAPLDLKLTQNSGAINAPSGATAIDLQSIMAGLGGGL
jgi:hypothetical protein